VCKDGARAQRVAIQARSRGSLSMLTKLGKYDIECEIGHGAMGVVYKAHDPAIGRMVALKTITTGLKENPDLLERFYREARAAGNLQHPNIVTIYDLGEGDGTPYIAMEFLEGEDLELVISERRPIPLSQKVSYVVMAARALDYAHKRGVVHRDVKPANIVVTTEGTIKVVDFGIARLVDASRSQTGLLIGTVNYMSPEQVRGEKVDGRSDIFSLGVMFYELIAGERPFSGTYTATMVAIMTQPHRSILELAPDCPATICEILDRALQKNVEDRYSSMEEFLIDLEPAWKRLQQDTVTEMVAESKRLSEAQDTEGAREVLRRAVLIDPTNRAAKSLLEKITAELKKQAARPRAAEQIAQAEGFLKAGKLQEAADAGEAALKLDSAYLPAKELLEKVAAQAKQNRLIQESIRAARKRLAEGSLGEAEEQLAKVRELDADNLEAKALLSQIADEKVRREKRKQLEDGLTRARALWKDRQHAGSIEALHALQAEFPSEDEILKLLETVQDDLAEQEKQNQLAEAKNLLASQQFEKATALLGKLSKQHQEDTVIQKVHVRALEEAKAYQQRMLLEKETDKLKKLAAQEKYADVIAATKSLSPEMLASPEIARLLEFANGQLAAQEEQRRLQEKIAEVRALLAKNELEPALKAAEKGLEQFKTSKELAELAQDARGKLKEQEKRQFIEKQMRAIKASIDRGNLTEAIDMGQQTLAQVKVDPNVTQLIQFAERERQLREEKKAQEALFQEASKQVTADQLDQAQRTLDNLKKQGALDARIRDLEKNIEQKRAARLAPPPPPPAAKPPEPPPPPEKPPSEYVYSAPKAAGPAEESGAKKRPVVEEPKAQPKKSVERAVPPTVVAQPPKAPVAPAPMPAPRPQDMPAVAAAASAAPAQIAGRPSNAMWMGIGAAVLVLVIVVSIFMFRSGPTTTPPSAGPSAQETQIQVEAQKLLQDRKLEDALAAYKRLSAIGGALKPEADQKAAEIDALLQNEKTAFEAARTAQAKQDWATAKTKLNEVIHLNGSLKSAAEQALGTVQLLESNKDTAAAEKESFQRAEAALGKKDYSGARELYRTVIGLGGANKARAERQLRVAESRIEEQTIFNDGLALLQGGKPDAAKAKFQEVVKRNGDLRAQATGKIREIDNLSQLAGLQEEAGRLIQQGRLADARRRIADLSQRGGDASQLSTQLAGAEKSALDGLVGRLNQARGRDDEAGLRALQSEFQQMAGGAGSQAAAARNYEQDVIPTALREIAAKRTAAAQPPPQPAKQPVPEPAATVATSPAKPDPAAAIQREKDAIVAVLGKYRDAYNQKNLSGVSAVWPSLKKGDLDRIKGFFEFARTVQMDLRPGQIEVAGDSASVVCQRTVAFSDRNGPQKPQQDSVTVRLTKSGAGWVIQSVQ